MTSFHLVDVDCHADHAVDCLLDDVVTAARRVVVLARVLTHRRSDTAVNYGQT